MKGYILSGVSKAMNIRGRQYEKGYEEDCERYGGQEQERTKEQEDVGNSRLYYSHSLRCSIALAYV